MAPPPTNKNTSADAIRIRDNQRRSRARKKEYLASLEERVRTGELENREHAADLQRRALSLQYENDELRSMLEKVGMGKREVDSQLASALSLSRRDDGSSIPRSSQIESPLDARSRHVMPGSGSVSSNSTAQSLMGEGIETSSPPGRPTAYSFPVPYRNPTSGIFAPRQGSFDTYQDAGYMGNPVSQAEISSMFTQGMSNPSIFSPQPSNLTFTQPLQFHPGITAPGSSMTDSLDNARHRASPAQLMDGAASSDCAEAARMAERMFPGRGAKLMNEHFGCNRGQCQRRHDRSHVSHVLNSLKDMRDVDMGSQDESWRFAS